jgi:hypothetical protein
MRAGRQRRTPPESTPPSCSSECRRAALCAEVRALGRPSAPLLTIDSDPGMLDDGRAAGALLWAAPAHGDAPPGLVLQLLGVAEPGALDASAAGLGARIHASLQLQAGPRAVSALAVGRSHSHVVVAVGGLDGSLHVWRVARGQRSDGPPHPLVVAASRAGRSRSRVSALLWVAAHAFLATGEDGAMRLWTVPEDEAHTHTRAILLACGPLAAP